MTQKAIVLHSGGLDSTATLITAKDRRQHHIAEVEALFINYGQRNAGVEQAAAVRTAKTLGIELSMIDMPEFSLISESHITRRNADFESGHPNPNFSQFNGAFTPGLVAMMLTMAHSYAIQAGANSIFYGATRQRGNMMPDSRLHGIDQIAIGLNSLSSSQVEIKKPLIDRDKADSIGVLKNEGYIKMLPDIHQCLDDKRTKQPWGKGCGICYKCQHMADAFSTYQRRYGV